MPRVPVLLTAIVLLAALGGCASKLYILSTRDGGTIVSVGKPELDEKAGIYTYTDPNGRTSTVQRDDVLVVTRR